MAVGLILSALFALNWLLSALARSGWSAWAVALAAGVAALGAWAWWWGRRR